MINKRFIQYLIGGILIILGIFITITYNGLVKKDEKVKLQWNEVQNVYQRRIELVPNLVNVVKGGAQYEQTTLQKVVEARAKATQINISGDLSADKYNQIAVAQNELAITANRLLLSIERYPELKGTKAFAGLQVQLEGTERRIKIARKDFNEAIATYNSYVKSFPVNLIAFIFGFRPKEGFKSDEGAEKAVEIKF